MHLLTPKQACQAGTSLKATENNGNSVFVEMLRGRDGVSLGGMDPQRGMAMGNKDLPAPLNLLDPLAPRVGGGGACVRQVG